MKGQGYNYSLWIDQGHYYHQTLPIFTLRAGMIPVSTNLQDKKQIGHKRNFASFPAQTHWLAKSLRIRGERAWASFFPARLPERIPVAAPACKFPEQDWDSSLSQATQLKFQLLCFFLDPTQQFVDSKSPDSICKAAHSFQPHHWILPWINCKLFRRGTGARKFNILKN